MRLGHEMGVNPERRQMEEGNATVAKEDGAGHCIKNEPMPCQDPDQECALPASEDYFRTLVENTLDIVTILDEKGTIRYESPSIGRVLGYGTDELIGRNVLEFIYPQDHDKAITVLAEAIHRPGIAHTVEVRLRHRNGSWRVIEAVGKCFTSPPDTAQLVLNSRDITERRRSEEEARQHQAELAHLLRLSTMGEMASGIAHELNQPLAAITNYARGCTRRIKSGAGEPDQILSALEEIAVQAMRAGEIIRRLRRFVRKGESRRHPVDLNELARDVAGFVEADAREHGVRIQLALEPSVPPVRGDGTEIEQVVLNLVRNAIEAVSAQEPDRRHLLLRTTMAGNGTIEVSVTDNGVGLSADIRDKIYDPFFSTKAGGVGMGLSISRSIVEAHGGRIWATANPDRGTTFHVALPLDLQPRVAAGP